VLKLSKLNIQRTKVSKNFSQMAFIPVVLKE